MAHDIEGTKFASFKQPAWHSIGTVFTDPLSCSEATQVAGADYEVVKVPHEIWHDGILLDTTYDLVRLPHGADPAMYYGTVSENYQVTNNMDIATTLDPLSCHYQTETVGVLANGKKVFWTFTTGQFAIRGEEINGYILVTEGKDGRAGLRITVTPVRVVCQNTLTMGLKQGTVMAAFSHGNEPTEALTFWADVMPKIEIAQRASQGAMNKLADTLVTKEQADAIIAAAFPLPRISAKAAVASSKSVYAALPDGYKAEVDKASSTHEYYRHRQLGFRMASRDLLDVFNQEYPKTANTCWAVANAVAEHEDHRRLAGDERGSAIFGDRMQNKQRAFEEAFRLAGVK